MNAILTRSYFYKHCVYRRTCRHSDVSVVFIKRSRLSVCDVIMAFNYPMSGMKEVILLSHTIVTIVQYFVFMSRLFARLWLK